MERAFGTELVIFGTVITVLWSITVLLATAWARNVMRQLESINNQLGDVLQRLVRVETNSEAQRQVLTETRENLQAAQARIDRLVLSTEKR